MATVTAPRSTSKRSSTTDLGLTLRIGSVMYDVQPIGPGEDGTRAFRLTKIGGCVDGFGTYDVIRTHDGLVECSCPDYTIRHAGTSACCKHGRSLVALGLIDAPRPVARPAARPVVVHHPFAEGLEDAPVSTVVDTPAVETEAQLRARLVAEDKALRARIEAEYPIEAESTPEPTPAPTTPSEGSPAPDVTEPVTPPVVPSACCPAAEVEPCQACVEPGPEPIQATPAVNVSIDPAEPTDRMTLGAWIAHVAAGFRRLDTEAGDLLADHVSELAALVELCKARDVATYRDRIATYA